MALIKYINWREEYGVNCLSRGDDDIEEQIAMDKAEVLDFPDHKGRSVSVPFDGYHTCERHCHMGMKGTVLRQFSLG